MAIIKEPINVDFYFDGKEMTAQDQKRVSDFIVKINTINNKKSISDKKKKTTTH